MASRREFLRMAGTGALAAGALGAFPGALRADEHAQPKGKAEHCIFLWLGGGMSQIDTWDPKGRGDGKKQPGCYYDTVDTAQKDVKVCKHLSRCAKILDRFVLFRTVNHDVVDEHAAATNRMHTGRPTAGTVMYPSLGSVVAHQRGAAAENVPAYVVIGYPNVTRGPGFLGSKYGYLYLTDTESGPNGLMRPPEITAERQGRREQLLAQMRGEFVGRNKDAANIADYDAALEESLRLAGPNFMKVFDLKSEPGDLRKKYGGEFGQRCLLARRLVQAGVRFTEVSFNLNFINGTGWDTHNQGQLQQHVLIEELDQALSALVLDLEKNKLLDKTLIVLSTEFGRPPGFDGGGGRGHQSKAFSVVTAGGGLKGGVVGETDELSRKPISKPVLVPDLFATIHCALGINPDKYLYDGDRPVPITDQGKAVKELFA